MILFIIIESGFGQFQPNSIIESNQRNENLMDISDKAICEIFHGKALFFLIDGKMCSMFRTCLLYIRNICVSIIITNLQFIDSNQESKDMIYQRFGLKKPFSNLIGLDIYWKGGFCLRIHSPVDLLVQ